MTGDAWDDGESAPGHQTIFNCILAGQCFTIIGVNCGIFCAGCPASLPRPPGDTKLEPGGNNPRHNRVGGAEQSITPATRHKDSDNTFTVILYLLCISLIPRFIKNLLNGTLLCAAGDLRGQSGLNGCS